MREYTQFYINGQWVDPVTPNTLEVLDPSTEAACATISLGSEEDVNRAVAAAKLAFESFSQTTAEERAEMLDRMAAIFKRLIGDIAEAIRLEMGAPISLASTAQAYAGLGHITEAAKILRGYSFSEDLGPHRVVKEPIGVCGLITPWNWPLNQVSCKVAPALAVGCTMVLKPSEIAPLSAYLYAEIMAEAGIPAGVFNLVNGDGPTVGEALSRHPDVDMMSFTGSTRAGSLVAQNAAPTVKRVTQELGGKSPNVILEDADLEASVTRGVLHMYNNTGQSCNAPSRMLVPRALLAQAEAMGRATLGQSTATLPLPCVTPKSACRKLPIRCSRISRKKRSISSTITTARNKSQSCCRRAFPICWSMAPRVLPLGWQRTSPRTTYERWWRVVWQPYKTQTSALKR